MPKIEIGGNKYPASMSTRILARFLSEEELADIYENYCESRKTAKMRFAEPSQAEREALNRYRARETNIHDFSKEIATVRGVRNPTVRVMRLLDWAFQQQQNQ